VELQHRCTTGARRSRKPAHRGAQQWENTLATYCATINDKRVDEVNINDVLAILKPIWEGKAETASRLRGRIERILSSAKVKGWRTGENPAAWKDNLDHLLPRRQKLQRGKKALTLLARYSRLAAGAL
jgi:hypothetical protein